MVGICIHPVASLLPLISPRHSTTLVSPHTYDDMLDFYVHSIEVGYKITGFITTLLDTSGSN